MGFASSRSSKQHHSCLSRLRHHTFNRILPRNDRFVLAPYLVFGVEEARCRPHNYPQKLVKGDGFGPIIVLLAISDLPILKTHLVVRKKRIWCRIKKKETLTYTDMDTSSNMSSSPASTPGSSLSVQAYTSQFIKEGLKIKMRQRLSSGSATPSPIKENVTMSSELEEYSKPKIKRIKLEDLAPEDMVKRQRRRERNKVAATKCRNKKKARTVNLMKVSETLDAQNKALKIEITKLEAEKSRLIDVLSRHQPNCVKKLKDTMSSVSNQEHPLPHNTLQNFEYPYPPPQPSLQLPEVTSRASGLAPRRKRKMSLLLSRTLLRKRPLKRITLT